MVGERKLCKIGQMKDERNQRKEERKPERKVPLEGTQSKSKRFLLKWSNKRENCT